AHDCRPAAVLCRTDAAARAVEPAGAVVAVAGDAAAPKTRRVSADATAVRHRTQGRDPVAYTVVADRAAARRGRARYPRARRSDLESANRPRRQQGAADDPA